LIDLFTFLAGWR